MQTPRRNHITNQNSFFLVISSCATLNETLTAKNNDILPRTPEARPKSEIYTPIPSLSNGSPPREDFSRRMLLLEYFHNFPSQTDFDPFHIKSTWTPLPHRDKALETFTSAVEHDILIFILNSFVTTLIQHANVTFSNNFIAVVKAS